MAEPSTSTASTASSTTTATAVIKSWADEADEETESPATITAAETSSVNLDALKIEDNDDNPPKLLDDPDDSNIQAVRFTCNKTLLSFLLSLFTIA